MSFDMQSKPLLCVRVTASHDSRTACVLPVLYVLGVVGHVDGLWSVCVCGKGGIFHQTVLGNGGRGPWKSGRGSDPIVSTHTSCTCTHCRVSDVVYLLWPCCVAVVTLYVSCDTSFQFVHGRKLLIC